MPREAAVLKPHDPSHFERVLRQRVSDAAGAHIFFRPSTMRTTEDFYASLRNELENIQAAGLLKLERAITSPQASRVVTADGREVINLCANNYLGLSSHPGVIEAAHAALDARGFGVSGARFICGTQDRHKELEARLSRFLGTEDTILYGSAFDAGCSRLCSAPKTP
jgi:7-keto-8-aminopelargonate synthetase-like enzyme